MGVSHFYNVVNGSLRQSSDYGATNISLAVHCKFMLYENINQPVVPCASFVS